MADDTNDGMDAYCSEDVQGDVLPGFRGRVHESFHQRFVMAWIAGDVEQARAGLRRLIDNNVISTGRDVSRNGREKQTPAFVNVAFTAAGLQRLGRPPGNAALTGGLAGRSVEKLLLGDPAGWWIGGPEPAIDVVINVGSTEPELVERKLLQVVDLLGPAYETVYEVDGALLPERREHFGFKDGLAQPFVTDAPAAARIAPRAGVGNRTRAAGALWPNWNALRLRAEAEQAAVRADEAQSELAASETAKQIALERARARTRAGKSLRCSPEVLAAEQRHQEATGAAERALRLAVRAREAAEQEAANVVEVRRPGVPIRPVQQFVVRDGDEFTNNGSYMVWLQLEQRPTDFWAMCRELATRVETAFGGHVDEELAAALCVGRHRDGAPLEPHPFHELDDFSYYGDPFGRGCPAGAHTRLMNARDVETADAMILRRGIPYGPPVADRDTDDGEQRGLIFVCYQADIERQYERLQGEFANAGYENGQPSSRFPDAVISHRALVGTTMEIAEPYGRGSVGMRLNNTWVQPRGGLYLFVPSMTALRALSTPQQPAHAMLSPDEAVAPTELISR